MLQNVSLLLQGFSSAEASFFVEVIPSSWSWSGHRQTNKK